MVNSASQALAEFKSQRMGSLLSGAGSTIDPPSMVGPSLTDSANDRLTRSAPKSSSTAFMDNIRKSGQGYHQIAMTGIRNKQAGTSALGGAQYRLPSGGTPMKGGPRGSYGLAVPAAQSFNAMSNAYANRWGTGLTVNSGGRTYQEQQVAYNKYKSGQGPLAAPPGSSLHESGIAVDIGGPITNSGSAQHAWLRQNAAQFKWYWVGQNFGEPWHWEYHPEW